MRILVVPRDFPSEDQPQSGIFVLRQALALRRLGHEIEVLRMVPFAPPLGRRWRAYRKIPATYAQDGITVRAVRTLVPPQMRGIDFVRAQFAVHLRREIARFQPDLVHAHCTLPTGALCSEIAAPVLLTAHGSDTYAEPWWRADLQAAARSAVRRASAVVAVSEFVRGSVQKLGRDDAAVIFNGADDEVFFPKASFLARAQLGIERGRMVVVFAGNLFRAKGIYDLAESLAKIADLQPLLLIAGGGADAGSLHARLDGLRVEHRMMGRVPQERLSIVLDAADVFAFPSHAEGLPTVVCEAMLAGRAVVATRAGGTPEIVRDGETGLLVGVHDVDGLAAALRRVLTDGVLRAHLESGAREFALAHLTWTRNALAYDGIYRQVADRQPTAHRSA